MFFQTGTVASLLLVLISPQQDYHQQHHYQVERSPLGCDELVACVPLDIQIENYGKVVGTAPPSLTLPLPAAVGSPGTVLLSVTRAA